MDNGPDRTSKGAKASRREFLKIASTSAPAAVAALAVTATGAEASDSAPDSGTGLRDTAHTRAYFDSARF